MNTYHPFNDQQPEAGPSSRPWTGARRGRKRQDPQGTSTSASSNTSTPLFPAVTAPSSSQTQTAASNGTSSARVPSNNTSSVVASPTPSSASTPTYVPHYTKSNAPAASSSPVPGVIFNMTLGGDADDEAIYALPVTFGHGPSGSRKRRRDGRYARAWNGDDPQVMNMQVDLGSSDMWVASTACTKGDCSGLSDLFDTSASSDSGTSASLTYQSGQVSGEIYWEEVTVGPFGISYQAFIAASVVTNEDLSGGNFTGLLGLAMPQNSVITQQIPGTTGSGPDGATFLDNLFSSGATAPSQRNFALSLERREDVRTVSNFAVGTVDSRFCPSPCQPPTLPVIAQPSLGENGYLFWRIQIDGMTATTWADAKDGTGPTTQNITLGASLVDTSVPSPIAILDSGGVPILVGSKNWTDSIYGAYGIVASSDGLYRMPCQTQIALAITIAGTPYPVHPLDMSWPDPTDPTMMTCIGAVQFASGLAANGDLVLGSSFLKNVYSIFNYPDASKEKVWHPNVSLLSITNASIASQDFYAVRSLHQPLSEVSANQQSTSGGTIGVNNGNANPVNSNATKTGRRVLSGGGIAAVSVIGFIVFAAALFCAWWFRLRRKHGAGGVVTYRSPPVRPANPDRRSSYSAESKNRKQTIYERQKSMIDGISDFDSGTSGEGEDSIRLRYMPEMAADGAMQGDRSSRASSRSRGLSSLVPEENPEPVDDEQRLVELSEIGDTVPALPAVPTSPQYAVFGSRGARPKSRDLSPAAVAARVKNMQNSPRAANAGMGNAAPPGAGRRSASARSLSLSMAGPFPSPNRHSSATTGSVSSTASWRPEGYDIRPNEYFELEPTVSAGGAARGRTISPAEDKQS